MAKDIAPELMKEVQISFWEYIKEEPIQKLYELLHEGKATYIEADRFAVEMGNALAKAFRDNISSDVLPDGKMYYNIARRMLPPELQEDYKLVADYAQAMQQGMNKRAKLGIKAVRPKYNNNREKGLIEYICRADKYDIVRKSFEEDLINFSQSVVTDTLKENAEFQYKSGLSPVIRRTAAGGCCEWCSRLAGTYPYEDVRNTGNDVYRRHRGCRCDVSFDPGDGKVQNVHSKEWRDRGPEEMVATADRSLQRGHSYVSTGRDVTKQYLKDATPGRGNIDKEKGFKEKERIKEAATAKLLHKLLGGDIVLKEERPGQKNPDYEWLGSLWDLKSTSTSKSANSAIRAGLKQIKDNPGGIILNFGNRIIDMDSLLKVIDKRMKWYPEDSADIIIISGNKIRKILRY